MGDNRNFSVETDDIENMDVAEDGSALVACMKSGRVVFHRRESEKVEVIAKSTPPLAAYLITSGKYHFVILSYKDETLVSRFVRF